MTLEPENMSEYDNVIFAMQRYMDEVGGPDRICNYCFHPRSSEFCRTSHPYKHDLFLATSADGEEHHHQRDTVEPGEHHRDDR